MRAQLKPDLVRFPAAVALTLVGIAGPAQAQTVEPAVREAYFRAVGEHFGVPFQEVSILSEGGVSPDEVPVVVFMAERAGVSSDALLAFRRRGLPWSEVAGRFGLDALTFHLSLPEAAELGPLAGPYRNFRARPVEEWGEIQLDDAAIVALVNLRVLQGRTGASPSRIMSVRESAGSFLAALPRLVPR